MAESKIKNLGIDTFRGWTGSTYISNTDFNDLIVSGVYVGDSLTVNRPNSGTSYYYIIVIKFGTGTNRVKQIAFEFIGTGIYYRNSDNSGNWQQWQRINTTYVS